MCTMNGALQTQILDDKWKKKTTSANVFDTQYMQFKTGNNYET